MKYDKYNIKPCDRCGEESPIGEQYGLRGFICKNCMDELEMRDMVHWVDGKLRIS